MNKQQDCKYCLTGKKYQQCFLENDYWYAAFDNNPTFEGHVLIILKRHSKDSEDLTNEEKLSFFQIVKETKDKLRKKEPGLHFNVGWNEGENAGQTKLHFHVHLFPRREGDVDDPIGGVRWTNPKRGNYLKLKQKKIE